MKLSKYANEVGVHYDTALRWYKAGKISGYRMGTGTIIITENPSKNIPEAKNEKVAIYTRVSSTENKSNLDSQAQRLQDYCAAKGYKVETIVKEVGSGINDFRPKLIKIITDPSITLIIVEHKDRLTRFGFNYIDQLLTMQGRKVEVINLAENGKEDLVQDFVSIITSFCARIYGQRRSKRKTEKIIAELESVETEE
jgi:putative resolvase